MKPHRTTFPFPHMQSQGGTLRILAYENRDGKDMFEVEYPNGRGIKWVHSYMIGGQYSDEKNAVKFRHEQRLEHERRMKQMTTVEPTVTATDASIDEMKAHASKPVSSLSGESLKCVCQQAYSAPSEELITCASCGRRSHVKCVRAESLTSVDQSQWQCPFCRVLNMDPFSPGFEILAFSTTARNMNLPASIDGVVTLRFNIDPSQMKDWQARRVAVSVRCVSMSHKQLKLPSGPLWPKEVTASVNSFKDVFKIQAAKYGHVRREPLSKGIEDMLRPNGNSVSLHYSAPIDATIVAGTAGANAQLAAINQHGAPRFLFAIVAAEPRNKSQILQDMRHLTNQEARERSAGILKLFWQKASQFNEDIQLETAWDADTIKSRCPLSLCEIEKPVRGEECQHIQCFDADAYIDVNMKLRNIEKRWRCPVCSKSVKPEDLIVDSWVQDSITWARSIYPDRDTLRLRLIVPGINDNTTTTRSTGHVSSGHSTSGTHGSHHQQSRAELIMRSHLTSDTNGSAEFYGPADGGPQWEVLPEEEIAGEGSDDEDYTPNPKIPKLNHDDVVHELE